MMEREPNGKEAKCKCMKHHVQADETREKITFKSVTTDLVTCKTLDASLFLFLNVFYVRIDQRQLTSNGDISAPGYKNVENNTHTIKTTTTH